jgi:integrase
VDALLKSINRKSPCGKRDYAILLLAARLGMRAGDIRTLRLDSLRWDDERIEYTQGKTGRKTTLPLTEEVGTALIDYLLHGRPHSVHREVFLRAKAPYRPLSPAMDRIIKGRCRDAKVKLPPGHAGMHSLRHTLAQRLLSNETPLETIAGILGHTSLNATRVYAKVNLKQLRTAALDPEEVYHA